MRMHKFYVGIYNKTLIKLNSKHFFSLWETTLKLVFIDWHVSLWVPLLIHCLVPLLYKFNLIKGIAWQKLFRYFGKWSMVVYTHKKEKLLSILFSMQFPLYTKVFDSHSLLIPFFYSGTSLQVMPKLYFSPTSPPCRCVLLLAKIINVQFDLRTINIFEHDHLKPSFVAVSMSFGNSNIQIIIYIFFISTDKSSTL